MKVHVQAKNSHVLKFISFLKRNHDMPFTAKRKVAEACIFSALLYGTETWLCSNFQQLEVQYNSVIRALLGVRKSTPNNICYIESGFPRLVDSIMLRRASFLKNWSNKSTGDEPLHKAQSLIHNTRSPRYRIFNKYKQFQPTDIQTEVRHLSQTKSRFRYYMMLNPSLVPHGIYHSGIPDSLRIAYTRLITSSHNLRSETGRWTRPITPHQDRLCNCGPYVQDEEHILTRCAMTLDIRQRFSVINLSIADIFSLDPKVLGTLIKDALSKYIH